MPERVQLSRAKGWRMPPNTLSVARPSRWGNPWRPAQAVRINPDTFRHEYGWFASGRGVPVAGRVHWGEGAKAAALADCVEFHALHVGPMGNYELSADDLTRLRGKNLACWCALSAPCHADVLLEVANR